MAVAPGSIPAPRTWVNGASEVMTAAKLNTEIRDVLLWLIDKPSIKVLRKTNQSITNNSLIDIVWEFEEFKNDVIHSNSSDENPSWVIINTPGVYLISLRIEYAAEVGAPTGRRDTELVVNGSTIIASESMPQPATDVPSRMAIQQSYRLTAGDRLTARVIQTSNETLTIAGDECEMAVTWVGRY